MVENQLFETERDPKLTYMILSYLQTHPNAMDTLEGIAEWWILSEKIKLNLAKVKLALDVLMDEHIIEKKSFNGQKVYYQLNKEHGMVLDERIHQQVIEINSSNVAKE